MKLLFNIFYGAAVGGLLFFPSAVTHAAVSGLYFDAPSAVGVGSEFSAKVLIDSDQPLNAYALGLWYPPEKLELVAVDTSRSVIDVSQDQPLVFGDGRIEWRGGSVAAFAGERGELLTLRLRARESGTVSLLFRNASVYLANGKGTKTVPETKNGDLSIIEEIVPRADPDGNSAAPAEQVVPDAAPPEFTFLSLIPDPFASNRKLLGFVVVDSGSGVEKALVRSRTWLWWGEWQPARNPVALPLAAWSVEIAGYDNAGNASRRIVYDWSAFFRFPFAAIPLLFFITVSAVLVMNRTMRRKDRYNIIET